MCEISESCPLRQKCALDFLFPHSHSQKIATRTAAIGIIMETTWRKANQTCQPKPLEHGCLPALDCSLSFVLSHIQELLCYSILPRVITNAPSPITFPLMLGFYRNLLSISSSKPCRASCILLYLRFMKLRSDIMSVPMPMPKHRQPCFSSGLQGNFSHCMSLRELASHQAPQCLNWGGPLCSLRANIMASMFIHRLNTKTQISPAQRETQVLERRISKDKNKKSPFYKLVYAQPTLALIYIERNLQEVMELRAPSFIKHFLLFEQISRAHFTERETDRKKG